MNSKKCKVAIIGYGGMGSWHAEKLMTMEEVELCGIYDISSEREVAAKKNGIYVYESLEALLADKTVELVTIAIPNDLHKEIAIKVMQAKKNVICEKPVALNSMELEQMIQASIVNGVIFTVHQNRRWAEDFLVVKKIYE
jgi:scyllo-inositol 2-dehydrogenase (NADP+)